MARTRKRACSRYLIASFYGDIKDPVMTTPASLTVAAISSFNGPMQAFVENARG